MTEVPLVAVVMISLVTATILLNTASTIEPIANDAINQTMEFTGQMNSSLDCAFKGVDLSQCADIYGYSPINEVNEYNSQLSEISEDLNMTENDN